MDLDKHSVTKKRGAYSQCQFRKVFCMCVKIETELKEETSKPKPRC